ELTWLCDGTSFVWRGVGRVAGRFWRNFGRARAFTRDGRHQRFVGIHSRHSVVVGCAITHGCVDKRGAGDAAGVGSVAFAAPRSAAVDVIALGARGCGPSERDDASAGFGAEP